MPIVTFSELFLMPYNRIADNDRVAALLLF